MINSEKYANFIINAGKHIDSILNLDMKISLMMYLIITKKNLYSYDKKKHL